MENRFSLVFEGKNENVSLFLQALQYRFEKPFQIANLEYYATACIVEMDSFCELTSENVMERSRYFMKAAKRQGKGAYLKITAKQLEEKEQQKLIEKALQHAINHNEIEVHYPPIFSLKQNRYVSAEALARLSDQNGNFIRPDIFIQVAEQNGMILELGMLIFEKVCKFIHDNPLEELGMEYIEINLSVVQFMQERLAEELLGVMKMYKIPPQFINLEITETATATSNTYLMRNMHTLISKGISFSLDDYGTGHSNLSYLIDLPVKLIKIDKSMIQTFGARKTHIAMECTVSMIKKLGLKIVAEGVETKTQLEQMKQLDIDYIQGFYYSKPLNEQNFLLILDSQNNQLA